MAEQKVDLRKCPENLAPLLKTTLEALAERLKNVADQTEVDAESRLPTCSVIADVAKTFAQGTCEKVDKFFSGEGGDVCRKIREIEALSKASPGDTVAWRPTTGQLEISAFEYLHLKKYRNRLKCKIDELKYETEELANQVIEWRKAVNEQIQSCNLQHGPI